MLLPISKIKTAPYRSVENVLEPVCSMLYQRDGNVVVGCPENLVDCATDRLRLKQTMLNRVNHQSSLFILVLFGSERLVVLLNYMWKTQVPEFQWKS
jgi:hypothetical protein